MRCVEESGHYRPLSPHEGRHMPSPASSPRAAEPVEKPSDPTPGTSAASVNAGWRIEVLRPVRKVSVSTRARAKRSRADAPEPDYRARALALWPRLDGERLRRTGGDVVRIARLVERRTSCSLETIIGMLTRESKDSTD
jgi:hypothetical protein